MIGTLVEVFRLLNFRERIQILILAFIRLALVFLDLAGMMLIGVAASLISGTQIEKSSASGKIITFFEAIFPINVYAAIGAVSILFFILKAVASVVLNSVSTNVVARIEAAKSINIFRRSLGSTLDELEEWDTREFTHVVVSAVQAAFSTTLNASSILLGEISLVVGVVAALAFVDIGLCVAVVLFFSIVAFGMNRALGANIAKSASKSHSAFMAANSLVHETIASFRQISTSGEREYFARAFAEKKIAMSRASAKISTYNVLPRYITEVALMSAIGILIIQRTISSDTGPNAATVAVFLAGVFRIVASLVSMQGTLGNARDLGARSSAALRVANIFLGAEVTDHSALSPMTQPKIEFESVSYRYKSRALPTISSLSISIPFGSYVAVTGPSGAGKSTFADLVLGLRTPTDGKVRIGGIEPHVLSFIEPNSLVYVPQNSHVLSDTLRNNLLLGRENLGAEDAALIKILEACGLSSMLKNDLKNGLDTRLNPDTATLSGGQIQRLGIARALIGRPKVLIFDESTSALDTENEEKIANILEDLRGKLTIIVISHRPRLLRTANLTINLEA